MKMGGGGAGVDQEGIQTASRSTEFIFDIPFPLQATAIINSYPVSP